MAFLRTFQTELRNVLKRYRGALQCKRWKYTKLPDDPKRILMLSAAKVCSSLEPKLTNAAFRSNVSNAQIAGFAKFVPVSRQRTFKLKAAKVQVSAVVDQCCKIDESRLHGSPLQTRSSIFWQLKKAPITSAKLSRDF